MTVTFLYDKGRLFPNDVDKLNAFKKSLKPGDIVTATFQRGGGGRDAQSRLFHALRDAYARETGYSMPDAKHELKYLYGIHVPYTLEGSFSPDWKPPEWEGTFVEMYGEILFMKSTRKYNVSEWTHLIDGTKQACLEVGVDLGTVEGAV